ncbi:unnamed protein product [Acanthoscelides obtectus]|uniref:Uncharacterized protein n=1 Tax=Acanthoscelides obtectus TaxID=200917 RepID=A0A9P0KV06_ACAOB|nr:unnamed protein product [Acanthoscelides obtectus]CAK1669183.1 hypothetical protein AOBTE_LOCUS26857 [Acanthoscelides obtectus]
MKARRNMRYKTGRFLPLCTRFAHETPSSITRIWKGISKFALFLDFLEL